MDAQTKGFEVSSRDAGSSSAPLAWIHGCRRLAKDYDNLNRTAIAFIRPASISLMLRSLTRYGYPS